MDKLTKASIDYINAIEHRLKISFDNTEPVFVFDRITKKDIDKLRVEISDVFSEDLEGMLHQTFTDGGKIIQGVGFGLVNDFEKFIKVGMLYSNRVILWDFLWGRILRDAENYKKNLKEIGVVSNNLIKIKESVLNGGIVILPHPLNWNKNTVKVINELKEKPSLYNTTNFGLVSTLSVALELNIHPYTLFDENTPNLGGSMEFNNYYNSDKTEYLYNITKLLDEKPFELINEVSVNDFYRFLKEYPDFFSEFRDTFLIPNEGKSEAEKLQIFNSKKNSIIKALEQRNKSSKRNNMISTAERITHLSALANIVYGLTTANPVVPLIISAITSLSASLGKHILELSKKKETNTLILGFEKLKEISKNSQN